MKKAFWITMICIALVASSVSAATPPTNLWGFSTNNENPTPDNTTVRIIADCYDIGEVEIVNTKTSHGLGYYDLNIPIDDPNTDLDEGCSTGDVLKIFIGNALAQQVSCPGSGTIHQLDLEVTNEVDETQPSTDSSSGGSGGSGGSMAGYSGSTPTPDTDENSTNAVVIDDGIIMLEKAPTMQVPPVNAFGFLYINGNQAEDGTTLRILADCYDNGPEEVATITTSYSVGYFDVFIPMDSPHTSEDEGCKAGQEVSFMVGDKQVSKEILPPPGHLLELKLYLGEKPAELESPEKVVSKKLSKEWLFVGLIILLSLSLATLVELHHKRNIK